MGVLENQNSFTVLFGGCFYRDSTDGIGTLVVSESHQFWLGIKGSVLDTVKAASTSAIIVTQFSFLEETVSLAIFFRG